MFDKKYRPHAIEGEIYKLWEESGAFCCDPDSEHKPYCIMFPPPNVTGSLHIGHALTFTLQDILIRYHRLLGKDVLWQPGIDHAGIATQMVVERQLEQEGLSRHDLGREAFVDRVWEWKSQSGGHILHQLHRLGASADWSRERFTMDEDLSFAVLKVFVSLYKKGLIYRDKRLVNWDIKLQTAISDLEVEQQEVNGRMWHFRYPVEGEEGVYVTVATTRPETMFGDSAVAVHPDDERYKFLHGKRVLLPISDRFIPIILDEHADPEKGTGAVKITPAHDFNDFEVGKRHDLALINIFDCHGNLSGDFVPEAFAGMGREEARQKAVECMESLGFLADVQDYLMTIPVGDRSGVIIEPWLMDQWFVDAYELAKRAIDVVETGKTRFVPDNWKNTYFEWMNNIQPWCISRQLWWGHRIPVWYGPDGTIFCEMTEEEAHDAARRHYGYEVELRQDSDVLDTWFSSSLWPFTTLGWPQETEVLKRYYPTSVLVTGFDIIFFWVARMVMMGMEFMDEVPFETVYIHALVRDEHGHKMSKSKGNVIDPLVLIDTYGADAVRFTLSALAAPGRDVRLSVSVIEGYRNFTTKLWNAARFCHMNSCFLQPDSEAVNFSLSINKWMVMSLSYLQRDLEKSMESYRFDESASKLYHFIWGTFCDWYLEFIKPVLQNGTEAERQETRMAAGWALSSLLRFLHPWMPFVTEELNRQMGNGEMLLISSSWPSITVLEDESAYESIEKAIRFISVIRALRSAVSVPPGAFVPVILISEGSFSEIQEWFEENRSYILPLARLEDVRILQAGSLLPPGYVSDVFDGMTVGIGIADVVDIRQEKARLKKSIARLEKEIDKAKKTLSNEAFLSRAPEDVIALQRSRLADDQQSLEHFSCALSRLSALQD